MSVYVRNEWYPISLWKATFASRDTVVGSPSAPFGRALEGRVRPFSSAGSDHGDDERSGQMNGAYGNQPIKSAFRGESWGDVAKLMRLVPLTAQDRTAIARDLRPVLVLTATLTELGEDRTGR